MKTAIEEIRLRYIGDDVLKYDSSEVDNITDEVRSLSSQMIEVMYKNNGIGLAAPQVGVNYRIIVIDIKSMGFDNLSTPGEALLIPQMPITLINPKLTGFGKEASVMEEGCLSVPGVYASVERPSSVNLEALLLDGKRINVLCGGFLARVLQHEIDHLNGVLFVEQLEHDEYNRIKSKLKKLDKKLIKKKLI